MDFVPALQSMNSYKRQIAMLLLAMLAVVSIFATYLLSSHQARKDLRQSGERQLQMIALDLEAVLERHETLPYTLSYLPQVAQVLAHPENQDGIRALNQDLQTIQQQAKIAAIYLMDAQGNTIAASNWDQPQSYIGQNFSFRPYFQDVMQRRSGAGHFYAIGNTTNIPGYFISQPVFASPGQRGSSEPIGVLAVKISLHEFEKAWRSSEDPIALSDRHGVVFLSNREVWQYRSLRPLDAEVQRDIQATLQYSGKTIHAISALSKKEQNGYGEYLTRPIGRLGWQLMLFPDEAKVNTAGLESAAIALLLLLVLATIAAAWDQRQQRLQERLAAQQALQQAAAQLEQRIAQRTRDLTQANADWEAQFCKLQQTEQVLRSTQNEMVQTGKLAMLGQMAAGITHELNQPLTAIRAFADNADVYLQRGKLDQVSANLHHISSASERMGIIIAQLKGFARKSSEQLQAVNVTQSVHAAIALLQNDLHRLGIQLELHLPESLLVLGDNIRLEQVIVNLLRNAMDAVEQQPRIWIEIRVSEQAGQVWIQISDSGAGLPDAVIAHLFEPFFTTKPSGQGLGLGLAISSSIVQAMNGTLQAENRSAGGACFTVRLPLLSAAS